MVDLKVGDKAPDFSLPNDAGELVKLSDLRGEWVVLTFYAEDDTPVCTQQACSFRDSFAGFRALGARVLAVSPDSVESHAAWRKKEHLPFELLSDRENKVATRYGAHGKKIMYGREVVGVIRSTLVIDPSGRIVVLQRKIRTPGHGARVLEALREAQASVGIGR